MNQNHLINTKKNNLSKDDILKLVWKSIIKYKYILVLILTGIFLFVIFLYFLTGSLDQISHFCNKDNYLFYWMLLVGFAAEMVAGSMGMGYGVICTTILLMLNLPGPVISASIHSAESFTSAAGAISHYKYGNVNKKLVKLLAIPAVIGAIIGALALVMASHKNPVFIKPLLACYTMYLGIKIILNAFAGKMKNKKKVNIPVLAFTGGFIDSFGGGGWGPLVTGTFIKNGRTPRYVIGSSSFAKFILTLASAFTFVFAGGFSHWNIVAGLLIGGVITAPFSAMLTSQLPVKKMFIIVGFVVIGCSLITIGRFIFVSLM
jgi:uncharacterized membrane protein YfcA